MGVIRMAVSPTGLKEVIWDSVVVGQVHSIRGENWNFYGKWTACESEGARAFLERLAEGKDSVIQIGRRMHGRIDQLPGDEIECRLCEPE
jgi:hypothetical protein